MPTIDLYKQTGEVAGKIQLDDSVFGVEFNEPLVHQVVVAQLNNKRQGTKSTLTRSEVRGGGRKPWRQKGTGNARQGSIRSPQWTKGGVVFAPKPRDFSQKVNKSAKRSALMCALSAKVNDGQLIVVDKIALNEFKTKEMTQVLKALNLDKRVLLVHINDDGMLLRACNNLEKVKTIPANEINVYDVVANSVCLLTADAVKSIEEAYKA